MRGFVKSALVLLGAFGLVTCGLAYDHVTGDCWSYADNLGTPTSAEQRRAVSLVTTYNEISGDTGGPGYYYKVTLQKGKSYVFWVTNPGRKNDFSVTYNYNLDVHPKSYFRLYELNGIQYYMLRDSEWEASDPATCTYFVKFECFSLKSTAGTLHWKQGEVKVSEPGEPTDPIVLDMSSDGIVEKTFSAGGAGNAYYFNASLEAGKIYRFATLFGTQDVPADIEIQVKTGIVGDDPGEMRVDGSNYNKSIDLIAAKTAVYEIKVIGPAYTGTAQPITLSYGRYASRKPVEHELLGPLSVGSSLPGTPGYCRRPDLPFSDDVIDECLFSFAAEAGHRYRFRTESASAEIPLKAVIYDENGIKLSSSTGLEGEPEVAVAFEAVSDGTYYVGVCVDESRTETVMKSPVNVRMEDVGPAVGEDVVMVLHPPLITDMDLRPQDPGVDTREQVASSLSSNRWSNLFTLACQSNFIYRLRAVPADAAAALPVPGLSAKVFRLVDGREEEVDVSGSLSPEVTRSDFLSFRALFDEMYYVRVTAAAGSGYEFAPYFLRSCGYDRVGGPPIAHGSLTVDAKGISPDVGAGWSSGTMHYPFGTTVYFTGIRTISFDSVSGMSKPADTNVTLAADGKVTVVGAYCDSYDHADDTADGAVALAVGESWTTTTPRSLLAGDDPADWFSFTGKAGYCYEFKLENAAGNPMAFVCGPDAQELSYGGTIVSFPVPSDGAYYVKVVHDPAAVRALDSTYCLSARSVDIGTVAFAQAEVACDEHVGKVGLTIRRTRNTGTVRVCWGTVAGSAMPGADYHAAGGEVVFADGGAIEETVWVPIIPDVLPQKEGQRTFSVRLNPSADVGAGEYQAVLSDPFVCKVTIDDAEDGRTYPTVDPKEGYDSSVEIRDAELALGGFEGVLREEDGYFAGGDVVKSLASVSVNSVAAEEDTVRMTAIVDVAGVKYAFAQESAHETNGILTATLTNGLDSVLLLSVPTGEAESLGERLPPAAHAELFLACPVADAGGTVIYTDTVYYSGVLVRPGNAAHLSMRQRLVPYVGHYTAAMGDPYDGTGFGYLSFDVRIDGTVHGQGRLADGTEMTFSVSAALVADDWSESVLKVPLRWLSNRTLFGGTLSIVPQDGGDEAQPPVIRAWSDDDMLLWGVENSIVELNPFGGRFDQVKNLGGLFANDRLQAGGDVEGWVQVSDVKLVSVDGDMELILDRASGILSGENGFGVVILASAAGSTENVRAAGSVVGGSQGFVVTASPASYDETEDWGFDVSIAFDGNGAKAGVPSTIFAQTAELVALPDPDPALFVRAGYAFAGWKTPFGILPGGAEIKMPAEDFTAVAQWSLSGLDEVLGSGAAAFSFDTTGDADWFAAPGEGVSGAGAMRSGVIAAGKTSVLKATAQASGTLTFSWSCECDAVKYAWCAFTVKRGGVSNEVGRIGGVMSDWDKVTYDVEAGDELIWTFQKAANAHSAPAYPAVGQDCAWLSSFEFDLMVDVTYVPGAGGEMHVENPARKAAWKPFGDLPTDADGSVTWADWSLSSNGWYWVESGVTNFVTSETLVPSNNVTLFAELVEKQWYVNFYDADGTTKLAEPLQGPAGASVTLPTAEEVTKPGYALWLWMTSEDEYWPGESFVIPPTNTAMTAIWQPDFADALGCKGAPFRFSTSGNLDWFVTTNDTAGAASDLMVQSGWIVKEQQTCFRIDIDEAGTLEVDWRIACDVEKYANCTFYTNDVKVASISGNKDHLAWETLGGYHFDVGDVLEWKFVKKTSAHSKPSADVGEDRVCLQRLQWTPDAKPSKPFAIFPGENVSEVEWTLDGVPQTNLTAVVEEGQTIVLTKICYALGYKGTGTYVKGYSYTLDCASCGYDIEWDVEATEASSSSGVADLPDDVTPAEAGITGGEFAASGTTPAEVKKVVGWALEKNGKAAVNGIVFADAAYGRVPVSDAAKAYVLNCDPADLETAAAAFRIPSISQDASGNWIVADPVGSFNGTVKMLKATTPAGPWSETSKDEDGKLFFKATLVK